MDNNVFINGLIKEVESIYEILNTVLMDESVSFNERKMNYNQADKLKATFKDAVVTKHLNNINNILRNRFGLKFSVFNTLKGDFYIITPPLDYKHISLAVNDLDTLFPKKQKFSVLWETISSENEKKLYKTLSNIVEALKTNKIKVYLNKQYIKGLEGVDFPIYLNFMKAIISRVTPSELVAMMLHEVGHAFTYIEYMFTTTKNTAVLLENFIYEKFTNNKSDIEALTIALEDTGTKVSNKTAIGVLQTLDIFTIKTYKLDTKKGMINIDFERLADQFATKLGMGDSLASGLVKISSGGVVNTSDTRSETSTEHTFIYTIKALIILLSTLLVLIVFNVFGILIIGFLLGFKFLSFIIGFIINIIKNMIKALFGSLDQDHGYDDINKRLRKIRTQLIRSLRKADPKDDIGSNIILQQIDSIDTTMKLVGERFSILKKYGDGTDNLNTTDNRELINEMIELLEDNEMYVLKNKFKYLNKQGE